MKQLIMLLTLITCYSCKAPQYYISSATMTFKKGKRTVVLVGDQTPLRDTTLNGFVIFKK